VKNLLKTAYGSVRTYTRHTVGCPHANDPQHNACKCPKWIYVWSAATGKQSRRSLATPSWAEAQRIAADALRGMDPEIAEARAVTTKQDGQRMTVAEACDLWIDRSKRLLGEGANTISQYRTLKTKLCAWADARNITHVQDITTLHLERWYSSREWSHLSPTTMSQRWGCLRSMFAFFEEREVIDKSPAAPIKAVKVEASHAQGPYTDNLPCSKRETYAPRLRVFVRLLLHTGCDVSDAILHEPSRLEMHKVDGSKVRVYRYRRIKTGVEAIIPIPAHIANELAQVSLEPGTTEAMPFRTRDLDLKRDQKKWSNRIAAVLDVAGITHVEVPRRDSRGRPLLKPANTKQLRHTFAVRQLKTGQRPEEVARMLGHVDTEMVRKHYAPWVKDLDDAHIRRVVSGW
jgi:site-specific recombinase XerD